MSFVSSEILQRDKSDIEDFMETCLAEWKHSLHGFPALEPQLQAMSKVISSPGKRIRPLLFAGSFRIFSEWEGSRRLPRHALKTAVALELFHAFLLIHDDVIDQSSSRRGEPTLHKRIENQEGARQRNAECSAIVLGDILQGYVFELLVDEAFAAPMQRKLIRYFARIIQLTGTGEALEIHLWDRPLDSIPESWIESVYELKTAVYSFECPMLLGAMLADAPPSAHEVIPLISRPLGIAFQAENDLHEISLDFEAFQALASDLKCGVKTLYLRKLYPTLSSEDQSFLNEVLAGKLCAFEHQLKLYNLLQSDETQKSLKDEVKALLAQAEALIDNYDGAPMHRSGLRALFSFILGNQKHSESTMRSKQSSVPTT